MKKVFFLIYHPPTAKMFYNICCKFVEENIEYRFISVIKSEEDEIKLRLSFKRIDEYGVIIRYSLKIEKPDLLVTP